MYLKNEVENQKFCRLATGQKNLRRIRRLFAALWVCFAIISKNNSKYFSVWEGRFAQKENIWKWRCNCWNVDGNDKKPFYNSCFGIHIKHCLGEFAFKFPEHYIMEFDQTTTQDAIHNLIFPRQSNTFVLVELNFDAQLAIIAKKSSQEKF